VDAGQTATAARDLRSFLDQYGSTPTAPDGYLLLAGVQEREGKPQEAIVTYEEMAKRFRGDTRVAAGLLSEAKLLRSTKAGDEEVRKRLAMIGDEYSGTPWFVPALLEKIAIEDRLKLKELDPTTGATIPASIRTRRRLVEKAPNHPSADSALWTIGQTFADLKQYREAAAAYAELGTRYPNTKFDPWFEAGDLYEKRLNAPADAIAAYLKVPASSSHYRDAQNRAKRLAGK
jgi:tetratricopeptide (TPR) repeat protein